MAGDPPRVATGSDSTRADDPLLALLAHLAQARVRTLAELAGAMDVDVGLVEQMLDILARGGYLQESQFCEPDGRACAGCSQAGLCRVMHGGRVWALTDKGLRAVGAA